MRPIRISLFALALAFIFSAVATDANAQETSDYDNLLVALDNSSAHVSDLQASEGLVAENVRVVRTSELALEEADATALNATLEANSEQITELQEAIGANEAVVGALEASEASAADVIAVHVAEDGSATVYVRDA